MISITKATTEIARKSLIKLYNLPLYLGSSSPISDNATLFLIEEKVPRKAIASHEMQEKSLWALRRRTHVTCLVLAAFCFSWNTDDFESLISTKEMLLGFSIVTTTELGAISLLGNQISEKIKNGVEKKFELWDSTAIMPSYMTMEQNKKYPLQIHINIPLFSTKNWILMNRSQKLVNMCKEVVCTTYKLNPEWYFERERERWKNMLLGEWEVLINKKV